jgi:peroxiredoxin
MHQSRICWSLGVALLVMARVGETAAQQAGKPSPLTPPAARLTDAEKRFDEIVRGFEQRLTDAGAFSARVISQWESSGSGKPAQGTNVYSIAVQAGGKLRVEAGSQETGERQFLCVSDGRSITRFYQPARLYSRHEASVETLDDLSHDAMTLQTLSGSGVDFLVRPQFRAQLIAQIARVEDLGREQLDGQDVIRFRLSMLDQRVFDLWFTTAPEPILAKMTNTTSIPIDDQRTFRLVTTGTFQWKIGGPHPEGTFQLELPGDVRRVNDLLAALQEGDVAELLGQPAPNLELDQLDGGRVSLAEHLGQRVVILIFWASWSAPSTEGMSTLNEFVELCRQQDTPVFAVNLGEDAASVRETVTAMGYRGPVLLDTRAESLQTYKMGALPITILIGKDGTVQAYHTGSTPEVRARVRDDVAALIAGKKLAP